MAGIIDSLTNARVGITSDHHYTHMEKGFILPGQTGSIAPSGTYNITFKTPPKIDGNVLIHFRPTRFSSDANSLSLQIYENAVMTGGTAVKPVNRYRHSQRESKSQISIGSTQGTIGTKLIFIEQVGSGGAANRVGGAGGQDDEIVLNSDTVYQFIFTNTGTVSNTVGTYLFSWYEED